MVEHIHRIKNHSNLAWKFPSRPDTCKANAEQVLKCEIVGEWDCSSDRNMTFTPKNHEVIQNIFTSM